eukprot:2713038-Prymnesium_polylepis.1
MYFQKKPVNAAMTTVEVAREALERVGRVELEDLLKLVQRDLAVAILVDILEKLLCSAPRDGLACQSERSLKLFSIYEAVARRVELCKELLDRKRHGRDLIGYHWVANDAVNGSSGYLRTAFIAGLSGYLRTAFIAGLSCYLLGACHADCRRCRALVGQSDQEQDRACQMRKKHGRRQSWRRHTGRFWEFSTNPTDEMIRHKTRENQRRAPKRTPDAPPAAARYIQ